MASPVFFPFLLQSPELPSNKISVSFPPSLLPFPANRSHCILYSSLTVMAFFEGRKLSSPGPIHSICCRALWAPKGPNILFLSFSVNCGIFIVPYKIKLILRPEIQTVSLCWCPSSFPHFSPHTYFIFSAGPYHLLYAQMESGHNSFFFHGSGESFSPLFPS